MEFRWSRDVRSSLRPGLCGCDKLTTWNSSTAKYMMIVKIRDTWYNQRISRISNRRKKIATYDLRDDVYVRGWLPSP